MNIDAHIIAWNEGETIHLTLKHYQSFCRQVYIYDNFSTDNTREICESMGAIVKPFGIMGQLNDAEYLKVKNHCWKGSDADWVIVCDADEILYNPKGDLQHAMNEGASIIKTEGVNMFSETMPKESWMEINTGVFDSNYSKLVCFNPKRVTEINYVYGCHEANPKGDIVYYYENTPIRLLHYKHVGGAKRIADRHALYASRMSELNKRWKMGFQYQEPREQTIKYFNEHIQKAKPIF